MSSRCWRTIGTFVAVAWAALLMTTRAQASAMAVVARDVAESIKEVPAGTWVVAGAAASDVPGLRADDLAIRVAGLIAGRIGKNAKPHDRTLPIGAARGHAKEASALLYVTVALDKGRLAASGDLYAVPKNAWDRLRVTAIAPKAHGYGSAAIDAEVRTFLPAIMLEQAAITKFKIDDADVLAAACGDGNGDGGLEIALVSRSKVTVGRFVQGRMKIEATAAWSSLAPRLAVPMRDPIATAAFEDDRLLLGNTDRGGVSAGLDLAAISRLRGLPINAVGISGTPCVTPVPAASALEGAGSCSPVGAAGKFPVPLPRFDGIAAAVVTGRDGNEIQVVAAREPQGRVRVRFGPTEADTKTVDGGGEMAVYDFDLDGVPELAVSTDTSATEDAITIVSLARGAEPRLRRRIPTTAPVRALAACPPEARGAPGLLAIVGAEAWLVR